MGREVAEVVSLSPARDNENRVYLQNKKRDKFDITVQTLSRWCVYVVQTTIFVKRKCTIEVQF